MFGDRMAKGTTRFPNDRIFGQKRFAVAFRNKITIL